MSDRSGRVDVLGATVAADVMVLLLLFQRRTHLAMLLQLCAHRRFLISRGATTDR